MAAIDRSKYLDAAEVERLRTVIEAQAVLDLQKGRRRGVLVWAVVDTALSTGLRVSEIARLTVGDVDPKRKALRVWRHKVQPHRQETIATGTEFTAHLDEFIKWKKLADQDTHTDAPLFVGNRGALTLYGLHHIWKAAIKKAGLPKELSIHCARHTLAVHLLRKTRNLRQVQKQLGHSDPATTANMYADVSFDDMQAGLNGLYNPTESPK